MNFFKRRKSNKETASCVNSETRKSAEDSDLRDVFNEKDYHLLPDYQLTLQWEPIVQTISGIISHNKLPLVVKSDQTTPLVEGWGGIDTAQPMLLYTRRSGRMVSASTILNFSHDSRPSSDLKERSESRKVTDVGDHLLIPENYKGEICHYAFVLVGMRYLLWKWLFQFFSLIAVVNIG